MWYNSKHPTVFYFYPFSCSHMNSRVQIQGLLIIYCHWKICFGWFPSVWACWLWSTHLCISCVHAGPTPVKAAIGGASCDHDSFTKGPHLITPKSGHVDTQEEQLFAATVGNQIWTTRHITNHSQIPTALHSHEQDFQSSVLTPKRFLPTCCQSWSNKPVYALNTIGTLDIPDRRGYRQVITAITASYYIPSTFKMLCGLSRLPVRLHTC